MITFGPIPSRRLGKSLGINNIPNQKICTYSCIYCQVGLTRKFSITRQIFYEPGLILEQVRKHLGQLAESDQPDYLTFVSNGEPTLDINLGNTIRMLKALNIPVAVITNASLISDPKVREELMPADWISVKVDSAVKEIWKKINRPHSKIDFNAYCEGLLDFSKEYRGKLVTETMLVKGINDQTEILNQTASLIAKINPAIAYISVPTRPPALSTVEIPNEININLAYQIFIEKGLNAELILGFEGSDTGFTGNAEDDILNISAVHPIREDTMLELLNKNNAEFSLIERLLLENKIEQLTYKTKKFYLRKHIR